MTMQENANVVEIFDEMGLKSSVGDFILGVEGRITPAEAAKRILNALKEKGYDNDKEP